MQILICIFSHIIFLFDTASTEDVAISHDFLQHSTTRCFLCVLPLIFIDRSRDHTFTLRQTAVSTTSKDLFNDTNIIGHSTRCHLLQKPTSILNLNRYIKVPKSFIQQIQRSISFVSVSSFDSLLFATTRRNISCM